MTFTFIDTANLSLAGKVPVGRNPRGIRFTADSRRSVACEQDNVVLLVSVAERKLIKSMPTGGERPVDIALSPDCKSIYVSHGRSEDARVFEADTWNLLATIPVGPRAWWVALTSDSRFLYVTVGRANEVVLVDTQTNQVSARIKAGELPWGVAIAEIR